MLELSLEERQRIAGGNPQPLIRDEKPECVVGQVIVLAWSRPQTRAHQDPLTHETTIYQHDRQPLLEIALQAIVPRRKGGWRITFTTTDRRLHSRLVRRQPPARNEEWDGHDLSTPPDAGEIAQARHEGNYTQDPSAAVDHLEAVDDVTLATYAAEAKDRQSSGIKAGLATCEALSAGVRELEADPELSKLAGRNLYLVRSRLDAMARDLQRKVA